MKEYVSIVVTYNRKKLLKENIEALLNQTYQEQDIMIIDNASNDGTEEMAKSIDNEKIKYYNTGKNLGGAGGFSYGLEKAINQGYKYAWIMDDDAIPEKEALNSLIEKKEAINGKFSYMASLVYWTDGKLFNMNVPSYKYKNKLDAEFDLIRHHKLMPINTCSFVGCFVNLKYASKVGLPISEFFIYGDDVEYTARLKKEAPAYLDLDSVIIHKAPSNQGADIVTAGKDRIARFYYQSRNGMYIARKNHTILRRIKKILSRLINIIRKSPDCKLKRIKVLISGTFAGLFFNPKIKFVESGKEKEEE